MANTFFKAQGYPVADSLVEDEALETAKELLKAGGQKLRLPVDVVLADKFDAEAAMKTMAVGPVPDGWRILDIGPETVKAYSKVIEAAGTVVWNGPMGVFEFPKFAEGTFGIAKAVAASKPSVSLAAVIQWLPFRNLDWQIRSPTSPPVAVLPLEMLEGLELPGVAALQDK